MEEKFFIDLKSFFKRKGITQNDIAKDLNVSQPYVNSILNGRIPIGKNQARRLSNLYGLSFSWLLTGEGEILANSSTYVNANGTNATAINGNNNNVSNATIKEDKATHDVKPISCIKTRYRCL